MTSDKKGGADTAKFKMKPKQGSPPGIELDGHGNVIPFEQRTRDDQEAALAAGALGSAASNPKDRARKASSTKSGEES